jgi:glycosyltransferase involved in cell wall biosynthesis
LLRKYEQTTVFDPAKVIVPLRDVKALANAIIDIPEHKKAFIRDMAVVRQRYAPQTTAAAYEAIFQKVVI